MPCLLRRKLTKMKIEKMVADLDDTVYDDEDIDSTYEEEVKSSSDSYDYNFKVDQTSNTAIQHDSKYWPLTASPCIFTLN